jgi:hypothetical protein
MELQVCGNYRKGECMVNYTQCPYDDEDDQSFCDNYEG